MWVNQCMPRCSMFIEITVADLLWTAPRRALSHTMSKAGVEVFAYLFSDPDAVIPPFFLELLGSTAPGSRGGRVLSSASLRGTHSLGHI